jgi:pimeloyl-ACP methyl ester carboxylesterase
VYAEFTSCHRGGAGPPLVCIHGFADTWRTWELVLPALEREHDVLAPTLTGHAGGPPIEDGGLDDAALVDQIERDMDAVGFLTAHLVGNSLGGYLALRLAERGRAETVVAFAPAGGWAPGDDSYKEVLHNSQAMQEALRKAAPHLDRMLASDAGKRRAAQLVAVNVEHLPTELLAHQMLGAARCAAVSPLVEHALAAGWTLDAEQIACPVRIVWGTEDRLVPWPRAAARYSSDWLPQADWVLLDGVGHCPQLDVPLETAQLILGFTRP